MSEAEEEVLGSRARDRGGRSVGPEGRLRASHVPQIRVVIAMALAIIDVGALILAVADVHGPVRFVLGLMLGVLVPGWALVGLLRLGNLTLEISLASGVDLALMLILAQLLMTAHQWHLVPAEEVTAVICLPSLLWQSIPGGSHRGILRGRRG